MKSFKKKKLNMKLIECPQCGVDCYEEDVKDLGCCRVCDKFRQLQNADNL